MSQKLSKHMNIIILDNAVGMCVVRVQPWQVLISTIKKYLSRDGSSSKWLPECKVLGQLLETQSRGISTIVLYLHALGLEYQFSAMEGTVVHLDTLWISTA